MEAVGKLKNYGGSGFRKPGYFGDDGSRRVDVRENTNALNEIKGLRAEIGTQETPIDQLNIL